MIIRVRLLIGSLIALMLLTNKAQAQVSISRLIPDPLCAGQDVLISYGSNQVGALSVHLYSASADLKLKEIITETGNDQLITAPIPINQPRGEYRIALVNIVTSGGTSTAYTSGTINVTVNPATPTPLVTTPGPYCQKEGALPLSATPTANNYFLKWYGMNATGGNSTSTPPVPSTEQVGTFTYYVSQVGNQCESGRAAINVTVNPKPDKPGTKPLSACYNSVAPQILSAVTASGTLKWYRDETGDNLTSTPVLATNVVNTFRYYVSQTVNGCESDRAVITYTVNGLPAAPAIPAQTTLYCQNAPASALQANATAGAKINWYADQPVGMPSERLIPSTKDAIPRTYYVSQTDANGCETAQDQRARITITTVSNPSRPIVNQQPVSYCQYETASKLSATPTTTNTLRWYGMNAEGGTPSTDAPTPSTDAPGSSVYYVSQIDGNQCEGSRAAITVNVTAKPTPPETADITVCQSANANPVSLATGVTATGRLTWYGDQNSQTAIAEPRLSIAVAGTSPTYYVSQTVNGCESDRRPIRLVVKALPDAPSVSNTPVVYCQNDRAQLLMATLTNGVRLNWYRSQPGAPAEPSIRPETSLPSAGQVYFVSQTNAENCEGPRSSITVVVNPKPARPTVTASQTACQNTASFTLSASGTNLKWYRDTTGTPLAGAPTVETNPPGNIVYFVSQTDGNNCESYRASITATVIAKPDRPVTAPVFLCLNDAQPAALTASASGTLNWYTPLKPTTPVSSVRPPASPLGTTTYYVSQSSNGCESDRASLDVTVRALPQPPTVNANPVLRCQNSTPVALTATATGTLRWYDSAPSNTALASIAPPTDKTGSTPYYVSQVDGNGCESNRTTVIVTVNPKPGKPSATSSTTACQGTSQFMLSASGINLKWYSDTMGTPLAGAPTITTSTPGPLTYFVSQTDANGCESYRTSITATIIATPDRPVTAPVFLCLNDAQPAALTASASGTLNWYTPLKPTTPVPSVRPPAASVGTTTYYVSQSTNGCEGPRASLDVTVRALPPAPTVLPNPVSLCQNSAPVALTATATGTLNWYDDSPGATAQASVSPPTDKLGLRAYFVTQTDANRCESSRTQVTVNVKARPAVPFVNANAITLCQNTQASALTALTSGTPNWYRPGETRTPEPYIVPSTTAVGQSIYLVSQTVNECESDRIPIVVTVQAKPRVPTVGANPVYCQGTTGTIPLPSASAPDGGALVWYMQQDGGIGTPTPPPPSVANAATIDYYVSQRINGCESDRVKLTATVKLPPDVPTVVPQVTACQNGKATLTATLRGGTRLNWYGEPLGGSASSSPPPVPTNTPGSFSYYVSQTDANGCESNRATITLRVNALPVPPAVAPVSFCQGATLTPLNVVPTVGTLNWYGNNATGGVGSPVVPVINTSIPTTTPIYVSQTDANGCESSRSILLVTINPTPAPPATPAIAPVCQGAPPVLLTASGTNLKWYADEVSTATVQPVQQTTQPGPYRYFVSQTINTCESPRTQVNGVINPLPLAPVVASIPPGCQDIPAQPLTAVGTGLQWYDQNDYLISPPTPITRVDAVQVQLYKVTQTVNGCVSPKATIQYTVNVTPPPGVVSPTAICQSLAPTALRATGTGLKWYDPTGAVTTTAPTPTAATVTTTTSYSVTQTVAGCESRKAEIRTVVTPLPTAKLDGNASIYLGGSAVLTMTLTGAGPYSYSLSDGTAGAVESAVSTPTVVRSVTVTPSATTSYSITAITNECGSGTATGAATITVLRPTISTDGVSASVCSGAAFPVSFSVAGDFVAGNSFTVELYRDSSANRPITISDPVVQAGQISAVIPPTVAAGQYYVRVRASNGRFPILGTRSPTVLTVRALPNATLSVSRDSIYQTQPAALNFTFTGDPEWTVRYVAETATGAVYNTQTTSSPFFSIPVSPGVTTTYRLVSISNNVCGPNPAVRTDAATIRVGILLAKEDPLTSLINVYPVPTDGAVTIDIAQPLGQDAAQLQLVGSDGLVKQELATKQPKTVLYLDKEPAGTYLLRITIGDQSTVRKILKR